MPIYEYLCKDCDKTFETFHPISATGVKVKCPVCGGENVKKALSSFIGRTSSGGQSCGPTFPT